MYSTFDLKITEENNQRVIDFSNKTGNFVELVLNIDGNLVKGFCYPPFHHKPIRRTRTGAALPFSKNGRVTAYVYSGVGEYKEDEVDHDLPPFILFKLNQDKFKQERISLDAFSGHRINRKVKFRRFSNNPIEVLEIPY